MDYVEVRFAQSRKVFIDGVDTGTTNKILRVGAGTHSFELGDPKDYHPSEAIVTIRDTNPLDPIIIEFHEVQP